MFLNEIEARFLLDFVDQILHGDDKHKRWLKNAALEYIAVGRVYSTDD